MLTLFARGRRWRIWFWPVVFFLAGCAGSSQFVPHSPSGTAGSSIHIPHPEERVLIIFSHGSMEENRHDYCVPRSWTTPDVLNRLSGKKVLGLEVVVYALCTSSITGSYNHVTGAGEPKVVRRAQAIEAVVQDFLAGGMPADHIFLAGHSAGAWASLLVARRGVVKINSVIGFAPAFAGKKAGRPAGWQSLRDEQARYLAQAHGISGLIYAFEDDAYEPAADVKFLSIIPGMRLARLGGDVAGSGGCAPPFSHRTAFRACFADTQEKVILDFIEQHLGKTAW